MAKKLKEMVESKRQLLVDISHELRTPLARARVAIEFIPDETIRSSVTEEVEEMGRLVHQILEGAQMDNSLDSIKKESQDIVAVARDITERFRSYGNKVDLISEMPSEFLPFDEGRMRVVIRNLIENAIKYSSSESPVHVHVSEAGNEVEISVRDQGLGIPESDLERVFEPFYRVDRSRTRSTGGFGLGLSLCKKIVQAHGGSIGVSSQEGKGSRFWLKLPK